MFPGKVGFTVGVILNLENPSLISSEFKKNSPLLFHIFLRLLFYWFHIDVPLQAVEEEEEEEEDSEDSVFAVLFLYQSHYFNPKKAF